MKQEQTKGHGYFRKKKWAKGLVSGIALAGAISFASTSALADEVSSTETTTTETVQQAEAPTVATQPESTNDNNAYAAKANQSTGTQSITIDNSAVTQAAEAAKAEGVTVTESSVVDKGTDTNTADLNESKEEIKADQEKQVATLKEVTETQAENNQAYQSAQTAIKANNDYVATSKATYEQETTVTTTNDSSTATDGTAQANKVAQTVAETTHAENKKSVEAYVAKKANYDATVKQVQILNEAIDSAASELKNKGVSVQTTTQVVNSASEVAALKTQNDTAIANANSEIAAVQAVLDKYAADLAAFNNGTNVSISAGVYTQNVDNLTYGDSYMNATINADGTFTFTHDMNDGLNDTYGTLGTGTLTGKLHYRVLSQGNGNVTVFLDSVELYTYSYTSNRQNQAVNQNLNFHVYTIGGTEIYNTYHTGNKSFTDTINRSTDLNYEHGISVGDTLANVGFLNIDDNWIYNTHGQAVISFTNQNKAPDPVNPPEVNVSLVTAENPEKPTLALKTLSETKNQTLSAEYHNYKLNYKPTVSKSVKDTDNRNTNGATVVKGSTQIYTLDHSNIYANIKVGDTITIKDPLEAGAIANQDATLERAANKAWNVAYDEATTTYTFTATYQGQRLANPEIVWTPAYDNGFYDNTYRVLLNDYDVYSNTVTDYTPEPPKPTKTITDTSGADINGSTVFDKQVHFGLTTDYSPYRKIEASQMEIAKKFAILDDVEDGKFTVDNDKITIVTTDEKQDVKDLFTMYHVLSDEGRTDVINAILKEANLSPVGEFYLWVANDSEAFYKNYIKQAKNITIDLPATLLVPEGVVVKNDFYQIDFGNGYQSNLVTVEVPDVKPEKHALDQKDDSKILDGQEVQIGEYIRYLLDGVTVGIHHDTLWQYDGLDRLDKAHDRYTGNWKGIIKGTEYTAKEDLVLAYDVTLADGTLVKAGDTIKAGSSYAFTFEFDQDTKEDFINKIVKVTWDEEKAEWAYTIDEDFLRSLGVEGTFDADFYIEVERIAAGEVENTFINTVNGKEMTTKVTTHTPEPPTPPAPNTPAEKAALLPSTGEVGTSSAFAMLGGLLMTVVGFAGLKRKSK